MATRGAAPPSVGRGSWTAVAAAAALVGGCAAAGLWLSRRGVDLLLGSAYPLTGHYRLHVTGWLAVAVVAAAALLRWGPRLALTLRWPTLLGMSWVAAAGWAAALAFVAGPEAVAAPLTSRHEYLSEVDRIDGMGLATYLRTFTWYIVDSGHGPVWTTHVAGHPPLATLLFVLLARAGLAGPGWAAALCVLVGAVAAPAVLAALGRVADEALARRAAPFVVAAPAALWIATSADAVFVGVSAGGICALSYAVGARGARRAVLAVAGGLALGGCLMLSYGLTLLAPIVLAAAGIAAVRVGPGRAAQWRALANVLVLAGVAVVAVLAVFAAAGFWWLDGFAAAARRVVVGDGWQSRPAVYFLFANPAALAVAVGPAAVAALPALVSRVAALVRAGPARQGVRDTWLALPAAAMCAVVVAIASSLSKGEAERIYLPFAVWLIPMAALLGADPDAAPGDDPGGPARGWLASNLTVAVLIVATTELKW